LKKLKSFQRIIALRIIKGYKTISYDASLILAELIPIELIIEERAALYKIKNSNNSSKFNDQLVQKPLSYKLRFHPAKEIAIYINFGDNKRYDTDVFT